MSDEALTTGWEADLPAEDSLLRAYVLATVERSEQLARSGGGRFEVTERATFADAGSPVLFDN
ncbi:MAG TPA: N-acetyltransferase, partial [Actinomycetota bacterium]|nr:N-acetyltransferase [Actinomycetota bacterium]